jgi:hypothetical protein
MPKRHESWSEINEYAACAIELASGLCFSRYKAAPIGMFSEAQTLEREADKLWPRERTIGQLAQLHLALKVRHLLDVAPAARRIELEVA